MPRSMPKYVPGPMTEAVRRAALVAGLAVAALAAAAAPDDDTWRTKVGGSGRTTTAAVVDDGYRLTVGGTDQIVPPPLATTQTASPLFDAMFALAQQELDRARV